MTVTIISGKRYRAVLRFNYGKFMVIFEICNHEAFHWIQINKKRA